MPPVTSARSPAADGCELCAAREETFRVVKTTIHSFAIVCRWPLKEGHLLVLPRRHALDLAELDSQESKDLLSLVSEMKTLLRAKYGDAVVALNTGAHASQPHLHFHVCPSPAAFRDLLARYEDIPVRPDVDDATLGAMRDRLLF